MTLKSLYKATDLLATTCQQLSFTAPATHVYHPLKYARAAHQAYLALAAPTQKRTAKLKSKRAIFLGINPGPWGMAQTGVPFGEVTMVREWMGIDGKIDTPDNMHPQRPVLGWQCTRSEVSGQRLWQFFAHRFPHAPDFFDSYIVLNYCPLLFLSANKTNKSSKRESVLNITPDKLRQQEQKLLFAACDNFMHTAVELFCPQTLIGIGGFAHKRLQTLFPTHHIGSMLHPSPASPAANRGFAQTATKQLQSLGLDF